MSSSRPLAVSFESLGYRSIGPRAGEAPDRADLLAKVTSGDKYHCDVQNQGAEHLIRRAARRQGVAPEQLLKLARSDDAASWAANKDVSFIKSYRSTKYAASHAKQAKASPADCIALLNHLSAVEPTYKRITSFLQGIAFAPTDQLNAILTHAFDIFFQWQPRGVIRVYSLSEAYESFYGLMRAAYTMEHCAPTDLKALQTGGFRTLRQWHSLSTIYTARSIFTQLDHFFYPYVTGFYGGPIGLAIHFVLGDVEVHAPGPWPPDWLAIPQSHSAFGGEQHDHQAALQGDPKAVAQAVHHRYMFQAPPSIGDRIALEQWCVERENVLGFELTDIANYLDNNFIDPIFALEHALTVDRVRRHTLGTNTLPFPIAMKGHVFAIADLFETLCKAHAPAYAAPVVPPPGLVKQGHPNYFKLLFHRSFARQLMSACIASMPQGPKQVIEAAAAEAYDALVNTVIESVFMPNAMGPATVTVRDKSRTGATNEPHEDFVANTMRALRNTHHGYLTRQDPLRAPSRYLSIVDGNVSDNVSILPPLWWLAFLGDPAHFAGVPITPIGQHLL